MTPLDELIGLEADFKIPEGGYSVCSMPPKHRQIILRAIAYLKTSPAIPAKGEDVVERVAKAICQEQCAGFGEPACWKVDGQWPNPNCESCHAMAEVAIAAMAKTSTGVDAGYVTALKHIKTIYGANTFAGRTARAALKSRQIKNPPPLSE